MIISLGQIKNSLSCIQLQNDGFLVAERKPDSLLVLKVIVCHINKFRAGHLGFAVLECTYFLKLFPGHPHKTNYLPISKPGLLK